MCLACTYRVAPHALHCGSRRTCNAAYSTCCTQNRGHCWLTWKRTLSLWFQHTLLARESCYLFPFYLISFKEDWIAYISPRASNQNRFGIVAQQRVESQTAFHVFPFFSYILENVFRSFQPGLFQRQTTFARHWYTQVAISERPTTILRANIYATVI